MEAATPALIDEVRRALEPIGRRLGCRLVVLFGSAARGEVRPGDIDLAILTNQPLDLLALTNEVITALRIQGIDLVDLRRADPLLMLMVAREGIAIYEEPPGEFARFASLAARRYADTQKFRAQEHRELREFIARTTGAP